MSEKFPWFVKAIVRIFRGKIKKIEGLENLPKEGAFIISANHQSFLDAVFMHSAIITYLKRYIYSISKEGLKKTYGDFGRKYLGMIYIDTSDKKKVINTSLDYLKGGHILVVFPEGGRNYDKENLLKGKTGAARLSLWAKVPVIPVGLISPKGKGVLESIVNFLFAKNKAEIYIGKPLTFEKYYDQEMTKEMLYDITKEIMISIGRLCVKKYPY